MGFESLHHIVAINELNSLIRNQFSCDILPMKYQVSMPVVSMVLALRGNESKCAFIACLRRLDSTEG